MHSLIKQAAAIILAVAVAAAGCATKAAGFYIPFVPPLYDRLTREEQDIIERVVQHEVGAFSAEYKTYIAELIYNRMQSEDFPDTVAEVIFQEGQFTGVRDWLYSDEAAPDDETVETVKRVFTDEEPSHDCVYYYNPALSSRTAVWWFEYSGDVEYVFSYSEESWGITYETRFFREA